MSKTFNDALREAFEAGAEFVHNLDAPDSVQSRDTAFDEFRQQLAGVYPR